METALFDYDTLRIIWWLILGVLLIGFAIMEGAFHPTCQKVVSPCIVGHMLGT